MPDLPFFIVLTVKALAGDGTMIIYCAPECRSIKVNTVAIFIMCYQVWPAEIPANYAFLYILFGKGKGEFAAYCLAYGKPAFTIYVGIMLKCIFVEFLVLAQKPDAAFCEPLNEAIRHPLFPFIDLID